MVEVGIDFFHFLSNEITKNEIAQFIDSIIDIYPQSNGECKKEDKINCIFDLNQYLNNNSEICDFLLYDTLNLQIWSALTYWKNDDTLIPILHKGKKQVHGSYFTGTNYGPTHAIKDKPEIGDLLLPFFYLSGKEFGSYLGIGAHELVCYLHPKLIFSIEPLYQKYLEDSINYKYIHPKIHELFEENGERLSSSAMVERKISESIDKEWLLVDKNNKYEFLRRKDKPIEVRKVRTPFTLPGYRYVEELLKQYWGTYYFDMKLAEDIGVDVLEDFSNKYFEIDNSGVVIILGSLPFGLGIDTIYNYETYLNGIYPKIIKRIRREYSRID